MAVRKISVSMPEDVVESAMESALRRELGLSAWLTEAVREKLLADLQFDESYRAARELVVEYEAENGPIPAEVKARTNESMRALGFAGYGEETDRAAG